MACQRVCHRRPPLPAHQPLPGGPHSALQRPPQPALVGLGPGNAAWDVGKHPVNCPHIHQEESHHQQDLQDGANKEADSGSRSRRQVREPFMRPASCPQRSQQHTALCLAGRSLHKTGCAACRALRAWAVLRITKPGLGQ